MLAHWQRGFRCVTTSLLGYGRTAERRTAGDTDISHEAEAVEAVISRAACPVHLVGHSFGGLTALAVALRKRVPLLSLTIAEAPAAEILRPMGEYRHYLAFRNMTDYYFIAYYAGDKTAIEQMIDFYGGAGTFSGWPQRLRDYAIETTPANLLDWASAYGFELTPALLATVEISTLVLWGEASHPAAKRANELLGQCLPNAGIAEIPGAAHFMISTHAREIARLDRATQWLAPNTARRLRFTAECTCGLARQRPGPERQTAGGRMAGRPFAWPRRIVAG